MAETEGNLIYTLFFCNYDEDPCCFRVEPYADEFIVKKDEKIKIEAEVIPEEGLNPESYYPTITYRKGEIELWVGGNKVKVSTETETLFEID